MFCERKNTESESCPGNFEFEFILDQQMRNDAASIERQGAEANTGRIEKLQIMEYDGTCICGRQYIERGSVFHQKGFAGNAESQM